MPSSHNAVMSKAILAISGSWRALSWRASTRKSRGAAQWLLPCRAHLEGVLSPINFSEGGSPKTGHPISAPATSLTRNSSHQIPGMRAGRKFESEKAPPTGGHPRTPASRLVPPPHAAHARPNVSICIAIPMRLMRLALYDCLKNAYQITSKPQGWELYCDEIEVQETHTKHRKLDS